MTDTQQKSRIPVFKNYQEEAAFWDTHDTTEFEDEFRPVSVEFSKNLSEVVSVRLGSETVTTLERQAQKKGVGLTTLIRMWLLERLDEQKTHHALR